MNTASSARDWKTSENPAPHLREVTALGRVLGCPHPTRRDPSEEQRRAGKADRVHGVAHVRARRGDDGAADQGADDGRQVRGRAKDRVGRGKIGRVDEVRQPGVRRRPEEARGEARHPGQGDDLPGSAGEDERDEHADADDVRPDHQPAAGEPVDDRTERNADYDRRQEVRDQERAHPPGRVRPVVDVDREGDHREPRADAGHRRREEERPERRRSIEQAQLAAWPGQHWDGNGSEVRRSLP